MGNNRIHGYENWGVEEFKQIEMNSYMENILSMTPFKKCIFLLIQNLH